jgi:hypothetical protein
VIQIDDIAFHNGLIVGMASVSKVTGNGKKYKIGDTILSDNLSLLPVLEWRKSNAARATEIAIDSADNIYATFDVAVGNKSVIKFDSSGTEIWSKTDIGRARCIAVDQDDDVYVGYIYATAGQVLLRKLDSSGNELWTITSDNIDHYVYDIKAYGGYVYVAATNVYKLNESDGSQIWAKTIPDVYAMGIDVDSSGVYVACKSSSSSWVKARKLDLDGNTVWSKLGYTAGLSPYHAVVDSSGDIYFSLFDYSNCIIKYDSAGTLLGTYSSAHYPTHMIADQNGNVYISSSNTPGYKTIQKFDSSFTEQWSSALYGWTTSLALCSDGKLLSTDYDSPYYLRKLRMENEYTISA